VAVVSSYEEYPHFFNVSLDLFEGPIDLLLHLVKQNELPIEKLSLAEVASQYLECLEEMRRFDLEVAGDYLVIAATLLSIKSSIILNEPVELVQDEDGNLLDPHQELLRRLREAAIYKDGAKLLGSRSMLDIDVFSTPSSLKKFKTNGVKFVDHDPFLLGKAFRVLLDQLDGNGGDIYTVSMDPVSVVDRMMSVITELKSAGTALVFHKLVPDLRSKAEIVATFIALLELCRRQVIRVRQDENKGEILIALAAEEGQNINLTTLSSEFDNAVHEEAAAV